MSFNYTDTHLHYVQNPILGKSIEELNIHGKIGSKNNPLIFGFGDEVDKHYRMLQDENINHMLDNIKSIGYFKTRNYDQLRRFMTSQFEVFIFGHSCGLSDRTLLHMIFNDANCIRIKIFYHGDIDTNNFEVLTQEISRHFYDTDPKEMRRKVEKFPDSEPMPQWNDKT